MSMPKIKKLKSGIFFMNPMVNGVRYSISRLTAKECKEEYFKLKAQGGVNKGFVSVANLTVGEVVDSYIETRTNVLSPSTIAGYKRIRRNHFQDVMSKKVKSIRDWQRIVNQAAETTGAKTLTNAWGLIHASLEAAGVDVGKVSLAKPVKKDAHFFEPEQILVFLDAIKGHRAELAWILSLHGLRFSETRALTKISIHDENIYVRGARVRDENNNLVYKESNKTEDSKREVPVLIPRLYELLKAADADKYLVELDESQTRKDLIKICRDNGLPVLRIHDLRHTFASLCYHFQIPEMQAAKWGGWSDLKTMHEIYTHLAKADEEKAARKLKAFFAS